jgi:hypothetical protein
MFEELAKQFNITTARVAEEYTRIEASYKKDFDLSGKELETEVLGMLQFHLSALTGKSKGELLRGMVLAVDKIKDQANPVNKPSRRNQHVEEYISDPDGTVASGKIATLKLNGEGILVRTMKNKKTGEVTSDNVTGDVWKEERIPVKDHFVVPLEDKAKWPTGSDNMSYLKALPLHQYKATLLISLKTDDGYKLAEFNYNSERHPGKIPMYVPIEFVATVKEEKDGVVQLGTSKLTSFEPIDMDFGKTPKELIDAFFTNIRYPILKLAEYHQAMMAAGKQWDTLVMIEGWIGEIKGLDKTPFLVVGDTSTTDTSQHIRVFLHEGLIPITYAQNSKVYIIGRTSQGDKYDFETKKVLKGVLGDVTIWALGVYPKYNMKPAGVKPVTGVTL